VNENRELPCLIDQDTTVRKDRVCVPPEWAPQAAVFTAWPADPDQWNGDLEAPRADIARLVRTLADHGNTVRLLVNGDEARRSASDAVGQAADLIDADYGDIWLRDTGPIFAEANGEPAALRFEVNGWGGKYDLPADHRVGDVIAEAAGLPVLKFDFVLEGGAVDHDGAGTILTTRQTLLNDNRNGWSSSDAEAALADALGAREVIWIDHGLARDHTDGHIDNLVRFAGPGHVVCQEAAEPDDPNAGVFEDIAQRLLNAVDAAGRRLRVSRIASVGPYLGTTGEPSPATHMNLLIANGVVVVPVYGTSTADRAVSQLQAVFPDQKVVGLPSRGLLGVGDAGGGSFHCITQQQPILPARSGSGRRR